jgi:hypothetical protein
MSSGNSLNFELNEIEIIIHLKQSSPRNLCRIFIGNFHPDHTEKARKERVPVNFNHLAQRRGYLPKTFPVAPLGEGGLL